jgi:DNA repair protein RecN (Recombination protein N)
VTHLPQVASYARHHWSIRKERRGNRTLTTIHLLEDGERLEELASMIRGESRGATTIQEATSMLEAARDFLRESPPRERHAPGRRKADG